MFNYINTLSGLDNAAAEPVRARATLKMRLIEARRQARRMQRIIARIVQGEERGLGQLQQYRHMV
ncbi:MAG TPA: hypothetical protein VM661_16440 [Candidatus Sulfotelmatobacter sp.]|jgi:hypothetical protein|nr:hypothetical protein [Candidatus Sulfotelmatobacter sp.]